MKKMMLILLMVLVVFSFLCSSTLEERIKNISKSEMQSTVEFLAHDLVEGRKPGTRGGDLAELYIMSLFKFLDLKPGINDLYLQRFDLKGFDLESLEVTINSIPLSFPEDIVGTYTRESAEFNLEGDLVFIGFGIKADLWNWDDYKNVDVRNKIVVTRVNDPGMYNPDIFEGRTLTYFGRWMYHIEEAARQGAAGILLIHNDESAGYGWRVVQNSWSGEELYLKSDIKNNLKFRAWIKEDSLRKILAVKNLKLDRLYRASLNSDFESMPLDLKIKIRGMNRFRTVSNCNVVGEIPGKSSERIVFSAHIDHFGIDKDKHGDNIYNGAIDNGTAVASMLVVAKILKEFQSDLHYTITFLACNSEEAGLLGSKFYVQNADRKTIIANINFESTPVWEKSRSIMGIGARFSTFEDILKLLAQKEGLKYREFSMSNQGFFYRSDQFSFARYDIPAIWISAGEDDESGEKKYTRFWKTNYHTVNDNYDPNWKLEGMKQTIKWALLLTDHLNRHKIVPRWKDRLTFPRDHIKAKN
jgi:Zn-dependent M28 family amino/carboxypeptidase